MTIFAGNRALLDVLLSRQSRDHGSQSPAGFTGFSRTAAGCEFVRHMTCQHVTDQSAQQGFVIRMPGKITERPVGKYDLAVPVEHQDDARHGIEQVTDQGRAGKIGELARQHSLCCKCVMTNRLDLVRGLRIIHVQV